MFDYESLNLFLVSGLLLGCLFACMRVSRGHTLGVFCLIGGGLCGVVACMESVQRGPLFHPTLLDSVMLYLDPQPYMAYGSDMAVPFMLLTAGLFVVLLSGGWFLLWLSVSYGLTSLAWRFTPPEKNEGPVR